MKTFTLKIKDVKNLNTIQKALSEYQPLTKNQQKILNAFLGQLPPADILLSEKIPLNEVFEIKIWDTASIWTELEKWRNLFHNLPGWDFCPFSYFIDNDNPNLLRNNVIMVAVFAPSLTYNSDRNAEGYEIYLKDDGTASFKLPSLEDAEKHPDLYNFTGSWKDAYLLLIETLQKGWPMEEFPEELKKFLPSK